MVELVGALFVESGDEMLDAQAVSAYKRRLRELDADLAETEANYDTGWSDRLRAERDALVAELSAGLGLGGRVRRSGETADRARKAVRGRLRHAIDRIGALDPSLGRHLGNSIRTGTFCSYAPEQPVEWAVSGASDIATPDLSPSG